LLYPSTISGTKQACERLRSPDFSDNTFLTNRPSGVSVFLLFEGHEMAEQKATNITWHGGTVTPENRQALLNQKGCCVWMTGLSASGKSTIGVIVEQLLLEKHKTAFRLDGDNMRMGLNKNLGFTAEDRTENIRRVGEVSKLFVDAQVITVSSFISPYKKDRDAVRALLGDKFVECYVHVSIEEAEKRDPKGLYKKARAAVAAGKGMGFTGVDDPYEAPEKPELTIYTEKMTKEEAAHQIVAFLESKGFLKA